MIWFATDELISSTKLVRNFSSVLNNFKNNNVSKIWILKNNNIEAVIISKDEYKVFEELQEYVEDMQDIALIEERMKNDDWTRISHEEMMKIHNIVL
jgi:PHD/YefM family antitoxin component YafN of YafNO toxin-antitoxin module